jgi:RNA polymerase sigma-70 factor (ECF subfamily)
VAEGEALAVVAQRLQQSATGDHDAFADVYTAMAPVVHGLALRLLRDPHHAEEVTQEVFLQAWLTCASFDPARGSVRTWMMTLAHRRAVDRIRSSQSARARDHSWVQDLTRTPEPTPDALVLASLEGERVRTALADLSELQRQALELSYFGGYTHVEVSQLLQVPLGTAKWRIREGLSRLRDALPRTDPDPDLDRSGEAPLAPAG